MTFRSMTGLRRAAGVALLVGMSLISSLAIAEGPASAATAAVVLSRTVGPPTTSLGITGSGFGGSTSVTVTFPGASPSTATTDSTGSFTSSIVVPATTLPGTYAVSASDGTLTASVNFIVRTDWPQSGFSAAGTGFNPYENVIGSANVGTLKPSWSTDPANPIDYNGSVTANGLTYVGSHFHSALYAFSANGSKNCSGTPNVCKPLWTSTLSGDYATSTPAVANGVVYVTSFWTLYAFSANGTTGCSGTPKVCSPLWTGSLATSNSSAPVVANGTVYVTSGAQVYAFSTSGTSSCPGTVKVCSPQWTGQLGSGYSSAPAVANGILYVGADYLYAFNAAGTTNCSGAPKVCQPLWKGSTSYAIATTAPPVISGGVVYIGSNTLNAFSASGTTNCSGTPKVCQPLWTGGSGYFGGYPAAVANGTVYWVSGAVYAFSAAGTKNCSGTPKVCHSLWGTVKADGTANDMTTPASVANGDVFVGDSAGVLYAYSANGSTKCTGTTTATTLRTCKPLVALQAGPTIFGAAAGQPVVTNGAVYVTTANGAVSSFKP